MLPTLILAAGLGRRLDPLTRLVAKPAVPLGRLTLIERVLDWVRRQGVSDVVLNLHHRPASLTGIVGDGAHLGLHVRYSWEQPILGSAGGPKRALPLLDGDPVLIVNGDTLVDFDLTPMLDTHRRTGADVTLAVVPHPAPDHYNGIAMDEAGRITGFVPRGQASGSWHFIGVQIAERRVFEGLVDGVAAETIGGIYRDLVTTGAARLTGWPARTRFLDVGTPRDYLAAALAFADEPGAQSAARLPAGVHRSVVWADARMASDVELDGCIVAGGVRLPPGFGCRDALITPSALVTDTDVVDVRNGVAIFPLASYNDPRG